MKPSPTMTQKFPFFSLSVVAAENFFVLDDGDG
jgi:hypothetical protein